MKANNQFMAKQEDRKPQKLSEIYLGKGAIQMFQRALGDEQAARRVLTTVLTVVQNNQKLRECDPASVMNAALDGEVAKNLSLTNGEYAIVPYKTTATMQIMVNGLKKMCIRSKAYRDIDCFDVREGEFKGFDSRTRRPIVEWISDTELREQLPIVGYYAFYELSDEYNNFTKALYWTHDQILRHADRYSKAFSLDTWKQLMAGEITGWDAEKLRRGSPWYGDPMDVGHQKMCRKTVLKQLLGDGLAPKEINLVLNRDNAMEKSGEPILQDMDFFDASSPDAQESPSEAREAPTSGEQGQGNVTTPPEKKSSRKSNQTVKSEEPPVIEVSEDELIPVEDGGEDFEQSFFG